MPKGKPNSPLIDRFLRRVNKQGKIVSEELGNCWDWLGAKYNTGYGQVKESEWGERYTHRWSYKHYKGDIPEGHLIRHKCDNRCCVNPEHLETGTCTDNVKDMIERHYKPANRKFTREDVESIKQLRESGKTYLQIAEQYKCNRRTIERIFTGMYYTSVQ